MKIKANICIILITVYALSENALGKKGANVYNLFTNPRGRATLNKILERFRGEKRKESGEKLIEI